MNVDTNNPTIHVSSKTPELSSDSSASNFTKKIHNIAKQGLYHTSLAYTQASQFVYSDTYQWWNQIKDTQIILGAIPLKNQNHHLKIFELAAHSDTDTPKLAILTLLEPFEYNSEGLFSIPVKPEDWEKMGVKQKTISAGDFHPLTQEQIRESVSFLEEQHDLGIPTYVHCKAGRGRSATAVVCFLMKKYNYPAELAKQKTLESRCQINLNSRQWQAVKIYEGSL
ncbi:MAG TPA: dual specificity protein phosphatase family protein [Parachlamydiaceae bacterium]|nr:dual specificity protein phosphatase family protein [Parachlamydiaceae bacterium]